MKRRITQSMIAVAGTVLLAACGGSEPIEADKPADFAESINETIETMNEVEIRDKPSLNKNDRVANAYIQSMDRYAKVLESVSDEASARKATETMAEITQEHAELFEEFEGDARARQMGLTRALMSRQQELTAVQMRVAAQTMRINMEHPELMQILSRPMAEMNR